MKKIAIIDDDQHIGDMLSELLIREGYQVQRAYSGTEALLLLSDTKPDLILLDLMLPGLSGEEVLQKINDIPVIVISAKVDTEDKVNLLLGGAADYITKPFDTKELLARITVQLRNSGNPIASAILQYGQLSLDLNRRQVTAGEQVVRLTKTEYAILKLLMQNPTQVITKNQMLDRISEDTPDCVESSLKVHISNLRRKLRQCTGKN
ncbi:MAG: response regulator transcription factor, partial [Emergencia timonensis]